MHSIEKLFVIAGVKGIFFMFAATSASLIIVLLYVIILTGNTIRLSHIYAPSIFRLFIYVAISF